MASLAAAKRCNPTRGAPFSPPPTTSPSSLLTAAETEGGGGGGEEDNGRELCRSRCAIADTHTHREREREREVDRERWTEKCPCVKKGDTEEEKAD